MPISRRVAAAIVTGACLAGCLAGCQVKLPDAAFSGLAEALGIARKSPVPAEPRIELDGDPAPEATPSPSPELKISRFEPPAVWAGQPLKIFGEGFSKEPSEIAVTFSPGVGGEVQASADGLLVLEVPHAARSGVVTVRRGDRVATASLTVIPTIKGKIEE